jgi:hypothetical protein
MLSVRKKNRWSGKKVAGKGNRLLCYFEGPFEQKQKRGRPRDLHRVGVEKEAGYCCEKVMEHLPNKSMRPSAASRKEIVSTPSAVTGTFANDCCD